MQYNGTTGAKVFYSWSAESDLLTLSSDFAGTANDVAYTHTFTPAHQWQTSAISNPTYRYTPPAATFTFGTPNALNQMASPS